MSIKEAVIYLIPEFFATVERPLVTHATLTASTFRFPGGVCGLKLANEQGELVMLPYQGQQIWKAEFNGRNLTMKSMCPEPRPGVPFLETFGGFMQHCGAIAMGGPSAQDTHPLHGELPNAPYQSAFVVASEDEGGAYIGLGGQYQHTVAFSYNYLAAPLVKLYAGSSLFSIEMSITNLKNTPMELMYLAHINFKPADHARLAYSAQYTPEHVRVRSSIPAHIKPLPGYKDFLYELKNAPEKHHHLAPELVFDPEVAIFIDYTADADGWAHSLHILPDGSADYVSHRPQQLPRATRWLCRTPDQDALALVEPGTAEPEGYLAEKAKGNLHILAPGSRFYAQIKAGALSAKEVASMEQKIEKLMGRAS
jgi:hypothetical protein